VALYMLNELKRTQTRIYQKIDRNCEYLSRTISEIIRDRRMNAKICSIASMFQLFFTKEDIIDYDSVQASDTVLFYRYFTSLLSAGVFVPPSQFETCFISNAHMKDDIDRAVYAIDLAMSKL